jgi:hypothetical protein
MNEAAGRLRSVLDRVRDARGDDRRWTIESSESLDAYNGGDGNAIVDGPAVSEPVVVVPLRDARGDEGPPDHQPPHGIPRRRDARGDDVDRQASHREQTIAEMDAARSPQDEDARGDDEVVEALRAAREYIADYSPRDDAGFYDDVVQERLDQIDAALAARSPP